MEGAVARTIRVMPGVSFDLAADGKPLSIEIFSTEELVGAPAADLGFFGEPLSVERVAELLDIDEASLSENFASSQDFPQPIVRLESGEMCLSEDIKEYKNTNHSDVYLLGVEDKEPLEVT